MLALFTVTAFLGAVLTFLLEPLVAKMVLPLFGGAPSVWNTCVLFFQAALLAGYGYSHLIASAARLRTLTLVHIGVMAIPLGLLPIEIGADWAARPGVSPVLWQLLLLLATAGLPFVVVSASAPLLQRWFSTTQHERASDPYFLYAASNLGSLLALLAYPLALEPLFDLPLLSEFWTAGYAALAVLFSLCALAARKAKVVEGKCETAEPNPPLPVLTRLRWLTLAFVPSSLMLSVTTHISTDIAAAPLLWVIPLAIYLATFVLAFARRRVFSVAVAERVMPLAVILIAITLLAEGLELPAWAALPLHLGGLLVIALACHGQLADSRPHIGHLTGYYFWIAGGGLAGGVFNALIAPALFDSVAEYPLGLVLACLLRHPPRTAQNGLPETARQFLRKDLLPSALLGLAAALLMWISPGFGLGAGPESVALALGIPALACYLLLMRPVRFALGVAALFAAGASVSRTPDSLLFAQRTYYGIHRVRGDEKYRRLYHGKTLHGIQNLSPAGSPEPLAYYHRDGPAGGLFRVLEAGGWPTRQVGVVGLGAGALAAYGRPGQRWTFYELDPTVLYLARDSRYFTYWRDAEAGLRPVVGDARISLARETGARFDLLVLDAFSSDAVPVHLLTREALKLYRQRLNPQGALAFHISNRFLDLESVVATLARDAGMQALSWADLAVSDEQRRAGRFPSHWVVLTENSDLAAALATSGAWQPPQGKSRGPLWTDRFSNIVAVFRWTGAAPE